MSEKGWGFMGSAASTVKDYTCSAGSSIGNSANAAWNSQIAASASSAVRAAGTEVKSWWNSGTEESSGDSVRGGVAAMAKNASNYVVKTGGRASNILNIYDKTNRSSLGNPRWWIRYDRPHGNVNSHHININPAVTRLKDPHIPISSATAKTVGVFGKVAETVNNIAPVVTAVVLAYDAYRIGKEAKKDYENGTSRNTVQAVTTTAATYTSGYIGASAGATFGSAILPGIGTLVGAIVGAPLAAMQGGSYSRLATEKALDQMQWDTATKKCVGCAKEFKKYEGVGGNCSSCDIKSIKSKL
ncbi:hypothetical protein CAEBREN_24541 [Caenorhabditis brenneri]|uniref:Uncharacterized protein n=1 Tax=Caenorhabditis brenneri TaxID=135651 RepID=G0N3C4_CAEBE|nr:hypothetical protein CAEBREN_24541 [Caenorhabditis brenneri]